MAAYTIRLICTMIVCLPFYALFRYLVLTRRASCLGKKTGTTKVKLTFNKLRELCLCLFVVFMIALLIFVWEGTIHSPIEALRIAKGRIRNGEGMNLIPLHTIRRYYKAFGVRGQLFGINIWGNIFMFLPWGFGLLLLWEKNRKFWRLLLFSALLPFFIEFTQLFIDRQVDVDDFILNFFGGMLGGFLFAILAKIFPKLKTAAL